MKTPLRSNYGLVEQVWVDAKDWRFGGVSGATKKALSQTGQYDDFLPSDEYQGAVYFDSMACVSFSALNCLETVRKVHGVTENFSDRFTAKMSGTTRNGNYLASVSESIRKDGLVDESVWPFPRTQRTPVFEWDDFYSAIPSEIIMQGKAWTNKWDVAWEWVSVGKLKDALVYGPLQVTVYAWTSPVNGIVQDSPNMRRNHAVMLYGYKEGEYWKIFDHYDQTKKRLAWDYKFGHALQYSLSPKEKRDNQTPMPTIKLPNDVLVQEVEQSGTFGLHINGKILLGDEGKLLATWLMRNSGNVDGKALPMKKSDWDTFPKFDLKNNPVT